MTIVLIAIIAGVIGLDQLTKWLAVVNLQGEPSFPLWRDVLHFTYAENTGMAFGMLKDHRWVFMVFSTIAIVALAVYLFRFRPENRWMQISMAFIIGGGIGNMIDRIFLGYVVDFIDFTLINFAVFNVADSFVCVGAGMMILYLIIDLVREIKLEKAKKAEEQSNADVE
jgi:signal peptidase II